MVTESNRVDLIVQAYEAALRSVFTGYRMGSFARPFGGGRRYWHVFVNGRNLALCGGLAVARQDELTAVSLPDIDCAACLRIFIERTAP